MALAAAQVIDALAARLVPLAATGGRVYTSRAWPLTTLPAWRVTAQDETITPPSVGNEHQHDLDINATAYARAVDNLDDTLHGLAAGGLPLLFADPLPYGLRLAGIDRQMADEGEAAVGTITLRLRALYFTVPAEPETIIG